MQVSHPQTRYGPCLVRSLSREKERQGTIANVVFPTGIDRRDDLDSADRFDFYCGMADNRIGVARLDLPQQLLRFTTHRPVSRTAVDPGISVTFGRDRGGCDAKADQKRTETGQAIERMVKGKELIADYSGSAKPLNVGSIPTRASR